MKREIVQILFLVIVITSCNDQIPFNSGDWKSCGEESIMTNKRLNMTTDLLGSNLLINKNRHQIDSLLGSATRTVYSNNNFELYIVKEIYKSDIDPDDLIFIKVEFNRNEVATKVRLVRESELKKR